MFRIKNEQNVVHRSLNFHSAILDREITFALANTSDQANTRICSLPYVDVTGTMRMSTGLQVRQEPRSLFLWTHIPSEKKVSLTTAVQKIRDYPGVACLVTLRDGALHFSRFHKGTTQSTPHAENASTPSM